MKSDMAEHVLKEKWKTLFILEKVKIINKEHIGEGIE